MPGDSERLARWITEASTPTAVLSLLLIAIGWQAPSGLLWGTVAALFCGVLPHVGIVWGVRSNRWTDRHVTVRRERVVPLLFSLASVAAGVAVLSAAPGVPANLLAVTRIVLTGAIVVFLVSLAWKISIHTSVASSVVVITAVTFGGLWLLSGVLVVVIAWSRVRLCQHTLGQTVGGAIVGTTLSVLLLPV
ncbi:hypothetical protein NLX83_28890 [Allokutzneria sp. A3M-2-11 16]|uniref:hypothetical protein n=1 Tax=Allokutzneria sp. A3M-2-11 16 TaxID=2962043 RepID=UPI0020B71A2A|nr:hypothetical protein [Allokutzneria sp. A3M-2-11 16]MCP3803302.1 hypothetical protein [Allokutzneria sp. A3M-2-11 16]